MHRYPGIHIAFEIETISMIFQIKRYVHIDFKKVVVYGLWLFLTVYKCNQMNHILADQEYVIYRDEHQLLEYKTCNVRYVVRIWIWVHQQMYSFSDSWYLNYTLFLKSIAATSFLNFWYGRETTSSVSGNPCFIKMSGLFSLLLSFRTQRNIHNIICFTYTDSCMLPPRHMLTSNVTWSQRTHNVT